MLPFALLGCASIAPLSAFAQVTQPANQVASTALEQVVVTAERRTTDVQKTAVAITAVSGEALSQAGVNSLMNIHAAVPDVDVTRAVVGMTVDIRGVVGGDTSPTAEDPNSVYLDGALIPKSTAIDGLFYDIARIEVLKGPQGTLYGRNSVGGAVNIITNKPVDDFLLQGSFEVGSYDLIHADGVINVPLTDTLAMRAAITSYSHKGYYKSGLDDADQRAGRVEFLWKPTAKQSLLIEADLQTYGGKGAGSTNVVGYHAPPGTNPPPPGYIPSDPRDDIYYHGPNAQLFNYAMTNTGFMAQYDLDLDFATWTTQFAHRDFTSNNWVPASGPGGKGNATAAFHSNTLETRLASSSTMPLQWIIGIFGFEDKDGGYFHNYNNLADTVQAINFGNPYEKATSYAVFGQATYTPPVLNNDLHLTFGARYSKDHKSADIFTQFGAAPYTVSHYSGRWGDTTYRARASYDVTDSSLLYATYATGYEAGGIAYGSTPVYKPERITDYEVGSKNRFFNNTLQLNLEGFYYKYKNYQRTVVFFNPGFNLTVTSAGSAIYKGVTADIVYSPTDSDVLKVAVSHLFGKYGPFDLSKKYPGQPDYTGTPIAQVPDWVGNASYEHIWDLPQGGDIDSRVTARFRGHDVLAVQYSNTPNEFVVRDTPWAMLDMSVRYDPPNGKWSMTGYVRNLTDGLHPVRASYDTNNGLISEAFYAPRTYGMILTARLQ